MTLMEIMRARKSYRGKYEPTPVPREHLVQIMEAGLLAPSGCNKQTTSLVAVDDPELLARLRTVINSPIGDTAPAMICVLTRHVFAYRDKAFYKQDYSAAIQNMLLMIESMGYATCWVEGHVTDDDHIGDQMAQILNIPEGYHLIAFLPVGVASEEGKRPRKWPLETRYGFNGFTPPVREPKK